MARAKTLARSHILTLLAACCLVAGLVSTTPYLRLTSSNAVAAPAQGRARVCTYYARVFENSTRAGEYESLLDLWRQSWASQGWEPTVLTQADAEKHPRYAEWHAAFSRLPTVNHAGYELSCYLRWVAALQSGCGWLVDIDVINYGFPPQAPFAGPVLYIFDGHVPAVVTGSPAAFEAIVEAFALSYRKLMNGTPDASIVEENGRQHTSDMLVISSRPDLYVPLGYPMSLKSPWARNASVLLHFSMAEVKQVFGHSDKARAVRELRPLFQL